jgi:hypothetical protein
MRPSTKFSIVMLAALSVSMVANAGENMVFDSPSYRDVASLKMHSVEDDSARVKAIREAGMSIGASGGFLERTKDIFSRYCLMPDKVDCREGALDKARALDGIFMFRPLVDEKGYLPPVISEISGSADISASKMALLATQTTPPLATQTTPPESGLAVQ